MHQITKSLLSLGLGLGLHSAVLAQSAPSESPKPKPSVTQQEKAKPEAHAKHKLATPESKDVKDVKAPQEHTAAAPVKAPAPAAGSETKPLQPMAAAKKPASDKPNPAAHEQKPMAKHEKGASPNKLEAPADAKPVK